MFFCFRLLSNACLWIILLNGFKTLIDFNSIFCVGWGGGRKMRLVSWPWHVRVLHWYKCHKEMSTHPRQVVITPWVSPMNWPGLKCFFNIRPFIKNQFQFYSVCIFSRFSWICYRMTSSLRLWVRWLYRILGRKATNSFNKTHRKSCSVLHPEIEDNSRFVSMAFQQAYRAWLILFQLKLQK